jgi:DNA-binding NtrC family response regulator
LSVVYGIVEQHSGNIDIDTHPGHGTTVRIHLPALPAKSRCRVEEEAPIADFRGNGERILLVEDEEEVLEFLSTVLSQYGYSVFEAKTAEQALEVYDGQRGAFDLIFSDVVLPGKSGLDLIDDLYSRNPEAAFLLSSGYSDDKSQWPIIRERGLRFLQKPYPLPDLLRTVRAALKAKRRPTVHAGSPAGTTD